MPDLPKYTLAIETATQKGSLSLFKGEDEIGSWTGDDRRALSSALIPMISKLLSENDLTPGDLELVAVSAGPGSFTGIRVGMSAAKALQTALGIPAIAVTLPEALALSARAVSGNVVAIISSGRTEVYWQEFVVKAGGAMVAVIPVASVKVDAPPQIFKNDTVIIRTSDVKPEYVEAIEGRTGKRIVQAGDDLAKYIGIAAIAKHMIEGPDTVHSLVPAYVKEFHA
jgi:tRNA threonylcarbamoyladenosine biosynthesis protein TsaB